MPKERTFTAVRQSGDIPAGHTFTESQFKLKHPIPDNPAGRGIDPGTYHNDLLGRLLSLGAIVPAKDESEPQEIPSGPADLAHQSEQMRLAQVQAAAQPAVGGPQTNTASTGATVVGNQTPVAPRK